MNVFISSYSACAIALYKLSGTLGRLQTVHCKPNEEGLADIRMESDGRMCVNASLHS